MSKLGRYNILTRIASGGMAEIYLAQLAGHAGFCKQVAIKKLLPSWSENEEFVSMLVDESKALSKLQHKNIVQIYELAKDGKRFLLSYGICLRTRSKKIHYGLKK